MNHLFEARLINGDVATLQAGYLFLIIIDADNVVSDICEASTSYETNISRANNRDIHYTCVPIPPRRFVQRKVYSWGFIPGNWPPERDRSLTANGVANIQIER